VSLSRLPLAGLRALLTLGLGVSALGAGALAAQEAQRPAVRRPTVPVMPVANVGARTAAPERPATRAGGARPAAGKPTAKPAGPKAGSPKPGARVAARATTPDTAADLAPVSGAVAGEVTAPMAPAAPARFARYRSTRDSVAGELARAGAAKNTGLRVVVQLDTRELAVLDGADTLLVAPVAIGRDTTIRYGARTWSFDTPRGKRTVRRKDENPVWVPPDWHYVEVAARKGFSLAHLPAKGGVSIGGGRRLVVKGGLVGVQTGKSFAALPTDEEIVFGNTLYVPPLGTANRRIEGELGRFRLDLGDGYQLHGTPHEDTIGDAATHGCIRLYDEDVEWLFQHVPLGTSVYIY
jgi:lipoprotein-anchoring transpeptidase ErfK/SrfK